MVLVSEAHWTDLQPLELSKYEKSKTQICPEYRIG